jgi:hypothetical protein
MVADWSIFQKPRFFGDGVKLADTLRQWSKEPAVITEMGTQARQMLEAQFTPSQE